MASPTEYYIDPTVASDGGAGTSGSPWTRADGNVLQYALDNITRDTTNGDRINVKSGTPHTGMTATISYATYGAPDANEPLIVQGYTSSANDGGVGSLHMNSLRSFASFMNYVSFVNISFDLARVDLGGHGQACNCTIENVSSGTALTVRASALASGCEIYVSGAAIGVDISAGSSAKLQNSYIELADSASGKGIDVQSFANSVERCIVKMGTGSAVGIDVGSYTVTVSNCSIYSNGGTGSGIECTFSLRRTVLINNNLIEGFSGTGGHGIKLAASTENATIVGNAVYNCDTAYDTHDEWVMQGSNETLSASPFTDAANDDFTPVDTGNVLSPEFFATVNGNTILASKGAVAPASGGSGSTVIVIEDD